MEALSDLKRLLCDVKEKTGTEVRLSPRGGDETRFTVEFGGERAEVYLDGSGKSAEQTAGLIRYLLANADMLRPAPEKDDLSESGDVPEKGGESASEQTEEQEESSNKPDDVQE